MSPVGRHRVEQPRPRRRRALPAAVVVAAAAAGVTLAVVAWGSQPSSVLTSMAQGLAAPHPAGPRPTGPQPAGPGSGGAASADAAPPSTAPPAAAAALVPEQGPRSTGIRGRAAPARPLDTYRVVGMGDSVPAGRACDCATFVSLAARQLAEQKGMTPSVENLAASGLHSADLLHQIDDDAVRDEIATADLVIIMVGANDFDPDILTTDQCRPLPDLPCYQQSFAQQRVNLTAALSQITTLTAPHGATVVTVGYWNVFLDGEVGRERGDAYVAASDALTQADNALIAEVSQANGATYVDGYTPFKGSGTDITALLAPDGDHPNAAGHALLAKAVVDAVT
jgi:lysophospholipase L1-like esterase